MSAQATDSIDIQPRIVRGRVDSLSLYEITEQELETLAAGSPHSTYLNFAVFFLSVGASFLTALFTAQPASPRTFTVFVVITSLGLGLGVVLLAIWYQTKSSVDVVIDRIKQRVPPAETEARIGPPVVGDPASAEG